MKPGRLGAWAPVVTWAALILIGTSLPPSALPRGPENSDKLAHLALYAVLAALFLRALELVAAKREHRPTQFALSLLKTIIFCAVFGALDEWHQQFVQRTTSLADWIADVGGAVAGAFGLAAYLRSEARRSDNGGSTPD